jgi:hypothetical protein
MYQIPIFFGLLYFYDYYCAFHSDKEKYITTEDNLQVCCLWTNKLICRKHSHLVNLHRYVVSDSTLCSSVQPNYFAYYPADTMMKFACFETIVEMVYKHAVPKPKDQCSKPLQLAVSFAGGYIAGVFCAAISHPADNLVSFLNNAQGATVADVRN